jgi:hypothetical protein
MILWLTRVRLRVPIVGINRRDGMLEPATGTSRSTEHFDPSRSCTAAFSDPDLQNIRWFSGHGRPAHGSDQLGIGTAGGACGSVSWEPSAYEMVTTGYFTPGD